MQDIDQVSGAGGLAASETNSLNETANQIAASIATQITYATQQNDVPVIADLAIVNTGDENLEGLDLTLAVDPPLIDGRTWRIDRLAAGGELRLRDRKVSLAGGMLSHLTERCRAELSLKLTCDGQLLAEEKRELIGLARNEWGGTDHMPELLAAFVMPNHPAVGRILKDASKILSRSGKQSALEGYQQRSRKRVWEIAAALWSAVAQCRLTYVEPPASFELVGQKIRTPGEVIDSGLATCLDTAVLFAAALEQSGLRPLIVFTRGHAFCGVWLQPQGLPGLITDDCAEIRKYMDLNELVLFETTLVTGDPPAKYSKAIEAGKRHLAEEVEGEFVYALVIRRARQQQITPLSAETKAKEGEAQEIVVAEALEEAPDLPAFDLGLETSENPETPEGRLDHWKRKLLDLTKRNRLLIQPPLKTSWPRGRRSS